MYYRPKIGVAADVIPFYEDGEFKLIYLHDYRDWDKHGEGCPWNLLTTKDLINYVDHGVIIPRGTKEEQDLYIFTGCVYKHHDEYYVYYTGHNPHLRKKGLPEQKVLLAKGKSLTDLKKVESFVFEAPDYLEKHDFRDPFVYYDEDEKDYKMLLAGRVKDGPSNHRGITMIAKSNDLMNWELEKEPFFESGAYFTHECPDYFKIGDWYYLIFSEFTDKIITRYRYSKNPRGPWLMPPHDSFDGHAYYAAKSVLAGDKRYLFGWNPIKYNEQDHELWQWGGTIIPHEIYQNDDGTLSVRIPESIDKSYQKPIELQEFTQKHMHKIQDGYRGGLHAYGYTLFNEMKDNVKIEFKFKIQSRQHNFGVMLRMDDTLDQGYFVKFDPHHSRFAFDKTLRRDSTLYHQVDTERFLDFNLDTYHHVKIIVEKSVITVYVDDKVAMGARMFDFVKGRFGIFSNHSDVIFKDIKIIE
ncbi:glycoside hydrolase family 32 protein [Acholeplasma laidlawii]|uniref:glycoside hydrolase family 32 protein n=1 Tax=Acholeplasma laidlawii TaxID=2148 RepID=UPI0021F6E472|nr:glycoside hydrolase family 32 protein [Acholeplasma laidlawii]